MTAQPSPFDTKRDKSGWRELAAVVAIILLILLLLPLLLPARGPRRIPEVQLDISNFEQAIAMFKVTYGVEPPSGIVLHADQAGWEQDRRSSGLIRQLWPKFDFAICGGMENVPPDGITLNGAECLVFFLGGIKHPDNGEMNGFSRNPIQPFSTAERGREGPFFEFKGKYAPQERRWIGRLVDQDRDGFPEYLDPLPAQTKPILYASSYSGKGYRVEDLGGAMRDVYRDRDGVAFKPNGLQLISPGADGIYGIGGLFDPEHANAVLSSGRIVERDNVTNFMAGTLGEIPDPRTVTLVMVGSVNLVFVILVAVACKRQSQRLLLLLVMVWVIVNVGFIGPAIFGVT